MFSIIISLLLVALAAVMTVTGVYYMGSRANSARDQASAATMISAASQIDAAIKLYEAQHRGDVPASMDALVASGFLSSKPQGKWAFANDTVDNATVSERICRQINERLHGNDTIKSCGDVSGGFTGCCSQ